MKIEDVVKVLNENQGVLAAIPIVVGIVFWLLKKKKANSIPQNSSYISAGRNISADGDIIVDGHKTIRTTIQRDEAVPEIHLQLYGAGSKRTIEGHVEKKGDITLILELIEINGSKTEFEQQFTKLLFLKNLHFSDSLFTTKTPEIKVKVVYRTLDGKKYELTQMMNQTTRADGLFNISLIGVPGIRKVK